MTNPDVSERRLVTILVPCYNEEGNLPLLYERLCRIFEQEKAYSFEVIVLDNASDDGTRSVAHRLCESDPRCCYLRYSRNFGYHASLAAGFDFARGEALIVIVGDMQDPPEAIPQMLRGWEQGYDVVYGVLRRRFDRNWLKSVGAKLAYRLIYHMTDAKIPPNATDLRLVSRRVINVIRSMREPDRYLRGLVHWAGFSQMSFVYDRAPRLHGRSNWGVLESIVMALHAIVCFSTKPLQIMTVLGFLITCGAVALAAIYLVLYIWTPSWIRPPPPGTTLISLLLIFLVGVNTLFLGVLGEYVGRIYNQGKGRPLYILDEKINLP